MKKKGVHYPDAANFVIVVLIVVILVTVIESLDPCIIIIVLGGRPVEEPKRATVVAMSLSVYTRLDNSSLRL